MSSRYEPPDFVVRSAALSVVGPWALLAMGVAIVLMPTMQPVAMAVAAGGVAAWGAWVGVRAADQGGFARRNLRRVVWLALIVLVAASVRLASLGSITEVLAFPLILPVVLLIAAFVAGRAVGRVNRRQADPVRTASAHATADNALAAIVAIGAALVVAVTTIGYMAPTLASPPVWLPIAWLAAAVGSVLASRPAVLHGRTATPAEGRSRWFASLRPILTVVLAVMVTGWLVVGFGLGAALRDVVPALPVIELELFDAITERTGSTQRPPPSDTSVRWQLGLLATLAVAYLVVSFRRRRRRTQRLRPVGPGMSLLMFLRSLLGAGRGSELLDDDDVDLDGAAAVEAPAQLARAVPNWIARFRRRPTDPAAAILHDYRAVQRKLPDHRRRRPSETVLRHAAREGVDDLAALADLVCAIRFAGHAPSRADADRSRDLTRRLTSRRPPTAGSLSQR